ncbi:MAG: amidohydrolase family protein [Piscinibacter sp.]
MTQTLKPVIEVPFGATDTHIHVYDDSPLSPTALSTPPPAASVDDYRRIRAQLGLTRTVIVQPSVYGTDNACTVRGIAALGPDVARGVAVVDAHVSEAELDRLTRAGMRGARFFMLPGGAVGFDQLDAIAAKMAPFGWHAVFQTDGRRLADHEAQIRAWPVPVIIDHTGKFLEPVAVDSPEFRVLLGLVETGRVFVKVSAPYETSKTGAPAYEDVSRLARALVKAAPERILWASNWPHPGRDPRPDSAHLLDILADWAPDPADRKRILVDNPAGLYGF